MGRERDRAHRRETARVRTSVRERGGSNMHTERSREEGKEKERERERQRERSGRNRGEVRSP